MAGGGGGGSSSTGRVMQWILDPGAAITNKFSPNSRVNQARQAQYAAMFDPAGIYGDPTGGDAVNDKTRKFQYNVDVLNYGQKKRQTDQEAADLAAEQEKAQTLAQDYENAAAVQQEMDARERLRRTQAPSLVSTIGGDSGASGRSLLS